MIRLLSSPRRYGVLIVGPTFTVLYANETACVLIRRLKHAVVGAATWGLPQELRTFCTDLLEIIYDRHFDEVFTLFQVDRKIDLAGKPVLLRGVGYPRSDGLLESFVCIVMEEVVERSGAVVSAQALTRERATPKW